MLRTGRFFPEEDDTDRRLSGENLKANVGEDKALMPRGDRRLQQIERARDIDVDKGLRLEARDIRLVQRAGMDHRLDRMIGKDPLDDSAVRDRSDDIGRFSDHY